MANDKIIETSDGRVYEVKAERLLSEVASQYIKGKACFLELERRGKDFSPFVFRVNYRPEFLERTGLSDQSLLTNTRHVVRETLEEQKGESYIRDLWGIADDEAGREGYTLTYEE